MTQQQTDQDALREQVRARYAAAATKVTAGARDCGCGQPADCGCDSGCCGAATAEEPGFGAERYAALDRDQLPDSAVLASLGCGNPTAVAELHQSETVLDLVLQPHLVIAVGRRVILRQVVLDGQGWGAGSGTRPDVDDLQLLLDRLGRALGNTGGCQHLADGGSDPLVSVALPVLL
jgi:hypothetical protein